MKRIIVALLATAGPLQAAKSEGEMTTTHGAKHGRGWNSYKIQIDPGGDPAASG